MTLSTDRYANWKAPALDGQILIWPDPPALLQQTTANSAALSTANHVRVQNLPLPELRKAIRTWLGHDDTLMIATGHQTELYHPGVWVKDALTNVVAAKLSGKAFHFAVDTDQPKHLNVRWPGTSLPLTDDPVVAGAEWCGLLSRPTPAYINQIQRQLQASESHWNFKPMLDHVLDSLRRMTLDSGNLSSAITNAEHQLDWELGLKHHTIMVSPMLQSEPYVAFVHHVLSRPEQFAADYNGELAAYRDEAGITSNMRPMPDLVQTEDTIEVPFWFDDLEGGVRNRAQVIRRAQQWLVFNDEEFLLDPTEDGWTAAKSLANWLRTRHLQLAPRAIMLTTFLRLLVVDQFVHGIGGGRYDQVTDRLIEKHFKLNAPTFAVTTGTLFFPGSLGRQRVCLSCVAQEGHRLKHRLLGDRKQKILAEIESLPRRSIERSLAFHNMHGALSTAAVQSVALRDWELSYKEAEQRDREDQVIFDRELFYAIQPRERLVQMIEQYRQAFAETTPIENR